MKKLIIWFDKFPGRTVYYFPEWFEPLKTGSGIWRMKCGDSIGATVIPNDEVWRMLQIVSGVIGVRRINVFSGVFHALHEETVPSDLNERIQNLIRIALRRDVTFKKRKRYSPPKRKRMMDQA
jgi:hypothetical protein